MREAEERTSLKMAPVQLGHQVLPSGEAGSTGEGRSTEERPAMLVGIILFEFPVAHRGEPSSS